MILAFMLGTVFSLQAQDKKDEGKIRIKITKKIDGEMKTFEGEYSSEEEMRNDPTYREWAGEDEEAGIWFGGGDDMDRIIELHSGQGGRAFSFNFGDDDSFPGHFRHNFKFDVDDLQGPKAFFFRGDDDFAIDLRGFDTEKFENEIQEKMRELQEKLAGLDNQLQEEIMESMRDIEELHSSFGPRKIMRGGISIEDVGDDFGKRGKVDEKNRLELDDINYMVMKDQLNLRFRVKEQGEMTVKISNEAGKDIYNRYFEKFGGTFTDSIDFGQYSDGKYLLEIEVEGKRLTKKIVID